MAIVAAALATSAAVYMAASMIAFGTLGSSDGRPGRPGRRVDNLVGRQNQWLLQAGYHIPAHRYWFACAALAVAAFGVALSITGANVWVSLPWAAFGAVVLPVVFGHQRRRRQRAFREAWPDGLLALLAGLRTGLKARDALRGLATNGPVVLRDAFVRFDDLWATHAEDALEIIKAEIADPTTDRVIEVLLLALQVGERELTISYLEDMLDTLQAELADEREIEAAGSEARITGIAVVLFAPSLLTLLVAWNPMFRDFYSTAAGARIIIGVAIWTLAGRWIITRLQRRYIEARVLVGPSS